MVTTIEQDADGLLWVGTEHGLNRFDGYHFTSRTTLTDDFRAIDVSSLLSTKDGRLWVGTSRGLFLHDKATGAYHPVVFPNNWEPRISSLLQLTDGRLLAGTAGYGLYEIDADHLQATLLDGYAPEDDNSYFNHLFQASDGCIWKSGANSQLTCRHADGTISTYHSPYGAATDFFEHEGNVYALCPHGFIQLGHQSPFQLQMTPVSYFTCSATDSEGNVYIGTRGDGLYWMPKGEQKMQRFTALVSGVDLNRARIAFVYFDPQGNLWVGCQQKGVLLIPLHRNPMFQSWSFAAQGQETGTFVSSIAQGNDSLIWCTIPGDGVYGFNAEGRIVSHPNAPHGVETLFRDGEGRFWLGTTDAVWRYNPSNGQATLAAQLVGDRINAFADMPNGQLAVSTYGAGLSIIDKQTGNVLRRFTMYDTDTLHRGRLANDWIYALDADRSGRLWIATSSGVSCYDPRTNSFASNGWRILADRESCTALCALRNGDVLLGSERGLQRWSAKEGLHPEEGTEPLRGHSFSYITEDNHGDLWISTNEGIWHWIPDRKTITAYVGTNGLKAREFVVGAGLHTTDGYVLLGTADGIALFNPDSLRQSHPLSATVHLTGLIIAGQQANTLTMSNGQLVMKHPLDQCDEISLSYVDASFQLQFSLLDFADAADVVFEYKLIDEPRWQSTPRGQNTIDFNHLAPGHYRLRVRALQAGNYTPVRTFVITVRPPWWRSTFAYWLYALAVLALLALVSVAYRRRMRRQFEEDKMQFLINATHDIRSPLTLILSPLEKLKERATDVTDKNDLDIIHRNAQRILTLVNQILDVRKIDRQQMQIHPVDTDLTALIVAICHMHDFAAQEHNIHFRFLHPDGPIHAEVDPQQIEKVVANLLSNAFKFTPDGGEITLQLSTDEQHVKFSVTDSGTGISPTAIGHIFDRFYQGTTSAGTGIGLHLCRMIVDMHQGTITAQNRNDGVSGSQFIVELPLSTGLSSLVAEPLPGGPSQSETRPATTSKGVILLVDDDTELSAYVASQLAPHYRCRTAPDGRQALQQLLTAEEGTYAAVVSDVMMPQMDGFTLLRLIKTNPRIAHLPVVMLTSKTDVGSRLEGLERGADAYLAKPFTTTELLATLRNLIAQRQRLRGRYSGVQQEAVGRVEVPEQRGNDEALMDRIMQSINRHLADSDFGVEQLCSEAGISRAHLHRKMKEMTGLPVTEFVRNIRLEQAARLLREQKLNITQVAYTVGFSNLGYFSTVFRKHFGVAPRDFAAQENGDD